MGERNIPSLKARENWAEIKCRGNGILLQTRVRVLYNKGGGKWTLGEDGILKNAKGVCMKPCQ